MKKVFLLILFLSGCFIFAQEGYAARQLSPEQIERVKAYKDVIADVDEKSLDEIVKSLEKNIYTEENLQIREAVAKTYQEIVSEQDIREQKSKRWLYSMVELNMAYLQLGGLEAGGGANEGLNKLILKKLKKYLSAELLIHPGIFHTLGY